MSHTEAGDPTSYPTSITLPDDGDGVIKVADVNVPFEGLADRTAYLYAITNPLADIAALIAVDTTGFATGRMSYVRGFGLFTFDPGSSASSPNIVTPTTGGGRWKLSDGRLISAVVQLVPTAVSGGSTPSGISSPTVNDVFCLPTAAVQPLRYASHFEMSAVLTGGSQYAVICSLQDTLRAFNGLTLSNAKLRLIGGGSHGALPTRMPGLALIRSTLSDGTNEDFFSGVTVVASDASANVAAYEVAHDITLTPTQNALINTDLYHYSAIIYDEGGTNAIVGTRYHGLTLTFSGTLP